jgi:hypothetical protein
MKRLNRFVFLVIGLLTAAGVPAYAQQETVTMTY